LGAALAFVFILGRAYKDCDNLLQARAVYIASWQTQYFFFLALSGLICYFPAQYSILIFYKTAISAPYISFAKAAFIFLMAFALGLYANSRTEGLFAGERRAFDTLSVIWFFTLFCLIFIGSFDLLVAYVSLEGASLMMAILIALEYKELAAAKAATKYFAMSCYGLAIYAFGFAFLFGKTGLSGFFQLHEYFASGLGQYVFPWVALVMMGFLFKLAAYPFSL